MEAGVGDNCVLVVCAIFNVYFNNFDDTVRVTFYLFFPRERVSHHSGFGLQRGLNRTKFMACGKSILSSKMQINQYKYKCLFWIKQNHRKPTFNISNCVVRIPIRCPSVAENQSKVFIVNRIIIGILSHHFNQLFIRT